MIPVDEKEAVADASRDITRFLRQSTTEYPEESSKVSDTTPSSSTTEKSSTVIPQEVSSDVPKLHMVTETNTDEPRKVMV